MKSISCREFYSMMVSNDLKNNVLKYHEMKPKKEEITDFYRICIKILKCVDSTKDLYGWFLDTDIKVLPDFDVLRFTKKSVINIDLKHENGEEKLDDVRKKFDKQMHVLKLLGLNIVNLVFLSDKETFLLYTCNGKFKEISDLKFIDFLNDSEEAITENLILKLVPSDYLISPLEDMEKFLNGEYWLTTEQENVVNNLEYEHGIWGVEGEAGTGKTLVAYDLMKKVDKRKKVLFVFSGTLRKSHFEIEKKFKTINIISAKQVLTENLNNYDLIIVDEAQRIYENCRQILITWANQNFERKMVVFFFHARQQLGPKESGSLLLNFLKTAEKDGKGGNFVLSKTIRSNPTLASFIKNTFHLAQKPSKSISMEKMRKIIDVRYFDNAEDAKPWIIKMQNKGYVFLTPTGDNYRQASADQFDDVESKNSHEIIGGEVDKVITYLDDSVKYDKQGNLIKNSYEYYYNDNEFYVNMSRAREKLSIAIINNADLYNGITEVVLGFGAKCSN